MHTTTVWALTQIHHTFLESRHHWIYNDIEWYILVPLGLPTSFPICPVLSKAFQIWACWGIPNIFEAIESISRPFMAILSVPHGRLAHRQARLLQPKLREVAGACWGMLGHGWKTWSNNVKYVLNITSQHKPATVREQHRPKYIERHQELTCANRSKKSFSLIASQKVMSCAFISWVYTLRKYTERKLKKVCAVNARL